MSKHQNTMDLAAFRTFLIVIYFTAHLRQSDSLVLEESNVTLAIPDKPLKWDAAAQYCVDNGGHLATISDDYVQSLLGTLMQIKGVAFLWIGARERDSGWTWADDDYSGKGFNAWAPGHPVNKDTEPACAFLRGSEDYVWVDHPCAMQHAFVCEMDISTSVCKDSGAFLFTGEQGGSCLILHQKAPRSWYKAREYCVKHGGRLAVFHNESVYKNFKAHLGDKLQVSGDYWLGLRDSSLQWQDGSDVIRTWWEGGQPSRAGRCVQMEKFGQGVYLWANHDCNRPQSFVCQLKGQAQGHKNQQPSSNEIQDIGKRWPCKNTDKGPLYFTLDKFINSSAAFILGMLVMLIPMIIMCKKKPSRNQMEPGTMKPRPPIRHSPDYATPASANMSRSPFPPSRSQLEVSDPLPPPPAMEQNIYSVQPPMETHHPHHYAYQNHHTAAAPIPRQQTYELPSSNAPVFINGGPHPPNPLALKPSVLSLVHQQMLNATAPGPVLLPVPQPKVPKLAGDLEIPSARSSISVEGKHSPTATGTSGTLYRVKEGKVNPGLETGEEDCEGPQVTDSRSIESRSLYSIAEV